MTRIIRAARTVLGMAVLGVAVLLADSGPAPAADPHAGHGTPAAPAPAPAGRKVLYYKNPMGLPDTSPVPKKDEMGMDYIPVYEGVKPAAAAAAGDRKILYYRNPMGLFDTSPVPKKDPMGMDYVPVYEGDESTNGTVRIPLERVQKLGVRTEAVARRALTRPVRAVGTVQVDERTLHVVAPKFEGWIEKLLVDTTGQTVRRGQPLMEVYSPELLLAQQEYRVAAQASVPQLASGALQRLRNLDIPDAEIQRLSRGGKGGASRTITIPSPASGVVLEKQAVRGMRFMPGETLYRIADLSNVWVIAEVFEQDLGLIRAGQDVEVALTALPGHPVTGTVGFIYPTLMAETRTGRVRVELANPDGVLRPGMYATVRLLSPLVADALTVPDSAVLDSGTRQAVLIDRGEGQFEPRDVKLGARGDGFVEVREGLAEGERVVVRANFLIDAESNLRAALGGFGGGHQQH